MSTSTTTLSSSSSNKEKLSSKLTQKLSSLKSPSKETLQTLARWILFHSSSHSNSLCHTLLTHLQSHSAHLTSGISSDDGSVVVVYLNLVQEILTMYYSTANTATTSNTTNTTSSGNEYEAATWKEMKQFRNQIANSVLLPFIIDTYQSNTDDGGGALNSIRQTWKQCLLELLDECQIKHSFHKENEKDGSGNDDENKNNKDDILMELKTKLMKPMNPTNTNDDDDDTTQIKTTKGSVVEDVTMTTTPTKSIESTSSKEDQKDTTNPITTTTAKQDENVTTTTASTSTTTTTHSDSSPMAITNLTPPATPTTTTTTSSSSPIRNSIDTPTPSEANVPMDLDLDVDTNDHNNNDDDDDVNVSVSSPKTTTTTTTTTTVKSDGRITNEIKKEIMKKKTSSTGTGSSIGADKEDKKIDFESEGIPSRKVQITELQEPCKSIATMQITRDLHSENAHNASSTLSKVPSHILQLCKENQQSQSQQSQQTNQTQKHKYTLEQYQAIPDEVLDLNLKEILSGIRSHKKVIQTQKSSRDIFTNLLLSSRCNFGSKDAASLFYEMRGSLERLKKRKLKILDAMELEGLDVEGIDNDNDDDNDAVVDGGSDEKGNKEMEEEFPWFTRKEAMMGGKDTTSIMKKEEEEERDVKRLRTE